MKLAVNEYERPNSPDHLIRVIGYEQDNEDWMKLTDFVVRDAILVDLQATTKEEAIRELIRGLRTAGVLDESNLESVTRAILSREELGSTGIGMGVAVPHTRHAVADRLIGAIGISRKGIEFQSIDHAPVNLLFLLISPPSQPGDHLRALESISRHLKNAEFVSQLRKAATPGALYRVLEDADQVQP